MLMSDWNLTEGGISVKLTGGNSYQCQFTESLYRDEEKSARTELKCSIKTNCIRKKRGTRIKETAIKNSQIKNGK